MSDNLDPVSDPLKKWTGEFGQDYSARNPSSSDAVDEAEEVFSRVLEESGVQKQVASILEVGANVGINLVGLRRALGGAVSLSALEPSPRACAALRQNAELALSEVVEATAYEIPFPDNSFDLVFTNGVLIHLPPDRLASAMLEIVRVSRRYVLCSEYFSHEPVTTTYRNQTGMLWKQDFGRRYLEVYSELTTVKYGFIWQVEFPHFDNLNWWLFEKGR